MRRFRVAVVHGVNLDQLGRRNPEHYGGLTFRELERQVDEWAKDLDLTPRFFQTNHEGALVEYLHRAEGLVDGILINAGAWTHYSWAIRDALELAAVPAIEVHLSNIYEREAWRHHSVLSDLCRATIVGRGPDGYRDALRELRDHLVSVEPARTPRTGTRTGETLSSSDTPSMTRDADSSAADQEPHDPGAPTAAAGTADLDAAAATNDVDAVTPDLESESDR